VKIEFDLLLVLLNKVFPLAKQFLLLFHGFEKEKLEGWQQPCAARCEVGF